MPMQLQQFMPLVLHKTTELLPEELRRFTSRIRFVWLQLHYHIPRMHYEVWLTRKTERIEIGLHFEGAREFSYGWAQIMTEHMPEVLARLGPGVELEEWTPSWARIHQTIPYGPLDERLATDIAKRLAQTIAVLQPIVEREMARAPVEPAPAPAKDSVTRRFRGRRTGRMTG